MNPKLHLLIVFFLCLVGFGIYASTAARTVTWAHFASSGPQLLTQIYAEPLTWGPNFSYLATAKLLRGLTSRSNFDLALPFNLFSAFWASLTIGVTYLTILFLAPNLKKPPHLTKQPNLVWLPPVFGSLVLAFSFTFWSQALVTQATTFNFFLFSLLWLLFLKINHLPKKKAFRLALWCLLLVLILAVNLLPSLKLPTRFRTFKQILTNSETIFFLITANFKTLSLVLALIGVVFGCEKRKPRFLLLGLFVSQILVDNLFLTATRPGFFLPSFLMMAIFSGLGFKVLLEITLAISLSDLALSFENQLFLLIFKIKKTGPALRCLGFFFLTYLVLATLLINLQTTLPLVDLKNEDCASEFGQKALAVLPKQAIVFCEDEKFLFTLDYFSKVVTPRQKLEISIFKREEAEEIIRTKINQQPIFFALAESSISPGKTIAKWEGHTLVSRGPLYQVQKPQLLE